MTCCIRAGELGAPDWSSVRCGNEAQPGGSIRTSSEWKSTVCGFFLGCAFDHESEASEGAATKARDTIRNHAKRFHGLCQQIAFVLEQGERGTPLAEVY
jgi:hypothetical protein